MDDKEAEQAMHVGVPRATSPSPLIGLHRDFGRQQRSVWPWPGKATGSLRQQTFNPLSCYRGDDGA
jgi:hypothetical protein